MPYIEQEARIAASLFPQDPGELNYAITVLLNNYVQSKSKRYQTFNDALGALEGAKAEFYRRVVVPYEEQKRYDNGDVYDL